MKKPPDTSLATSADYRQFVEELTSRVTSARISAARRINHDMIFLYGEHTRLACRLWCPRRRQAFQAIRRGLRRGRRKPHAGARVRPKIYHLPKPVLRATRATSILRQAVAEIPWGQNLLVLDKLTEPVARLWYLPTKANPIGVAAYALQSKPPGELKGKLPTAKQLAENVRAEMEGGE